jgi:hypothetical protein
MNLACGLCIPKMEGVITGRQGPDFYVVAAGEVFSFSKAGLFFAL